ncbi:MAG: restriction endonuclease subunit S [Methylobacter sp.]|uniref:restriction endonuclease subunit S n=1 Tax=Methylobacter sp. TaxID=2051955 RepID=UPI002730200A|nr:restriction endonuclease subunit S [Methylobacter sp.]MDP1664471.1 restriction endonuclease subunit S [Methylobacter sp.]MDP1969963.1 restriction endonuclease subunit S [Methylobacter sp.]
MSWPHVRLAPSLAQIVRGVTFSQGDVFSSPMPDAVSVLRAGNIQDRLIIDRDLVWISSSFVSDAQRLKKNDIVVCMSSGSSSIVGKSAILEEDFDGTWGAFNAVIRAKPDVLLPKYLSCWLDSPAFRAWRDRQVQGANIQNIRQSDLASMIIPLPTLLEQQRIVDVLQQAEALVARQKARSGQLNLMIKAYLDRLVLGVDGVEWVQLGTLVETRYGTSVSADEEIGFGTPVLRIPNVMGGEVDTTDMKYVGLSSAELDRLLLTKADVLIVRSNGNPDYVGRSAPITEDIVKAGMVYASYLIRLRTNTEQLLPEYLSSFLNSTFGRAAMRNTIRTTAGQSNLSGENLTKIRIPLPAISEQKKFAAFWHEVRLLRQLISQSERIAKRLQSELTVFALSGELTEKWREVHQKEIEAAIIERDQILRERGAKVSIRTEVFAPPERSADFPRPTRYWLLNELSEFQGFVLDAMREWKGTLLADNASDLDEFCRLWPIEHERNMHDRVKRALEQLAALGLIAKVALPNDNGDFVTGYRRLRPEEKSRLNDIAALQASLESISHEAGTAS